jgi:hypothetical protein
LLAPRPTPKLEDHPSSAVRGCLFNLFIATLHIGGRSSIRNLKTRHAVVTGTHIHSHLHKTLCNASNFALYINCITASFHKQNQHNTSTDCITTADSVIQSVAEIRQTFRNSAKKCRLYRQEIDSRLLLGSTYCGLFILLSAPNYLKMWKLKYKHEYLLTVLCGHKTRYLTEEITAN